jgi:hypothetical protein
MKRLILITLLLLPLSCFAGPLQQAHKSVIAALNVAEGEEGFTFDAGDAVYAICTDEYWASNSTAYGAANVDGHYEVLDLWQTARDGEDSTDQNSIAIINGTLAITSAFIFSTWTDKDTSHFFIIRNDPVLGTLHDGTVDGSGDTIDFTIAAGYPLRVQEFNFKIQNLRIIDNSAASTSNTMSLETGGGDYHIDHNVIYCNRVTTYGILCAPASAANLYVSNNIMVTDALTHYFIDAHDTDVTGFIYANSFYGTTGRGINGHSGIKVRNNCNFAEAVWYNGAMDIDYEATEASSGAGANSTHSLAASNVFIDLTMATADLHLNSGGSSYGSVNDQGVDLDSDGDLPITDDIDFDSRSATTPNIGADE